MEQSVQCPIGIKIASPIKIFEHLVDDHRVCGSLAHDASFYPDDPRVGPRIVHYVVKLLSTEDELSVKADGSS